MFLKYSRALIDADLPELVHPEFSRILACLVLFSSFASTCSAQANFDEDFDDLDKPWKEVAVQLPAAPIPENLLSFYVSPTATQTFAIDAKSLSIGTDGV